MYFGGLRHEIILTIYMPHIISHSLCFLYQLKILIRRRFLFYHWQWLMYLQFFHAYGWILCTFSGYEYSGIVQSPSTITSTSTVVSDAPDARPTSHQHNHHNHTSRSGSKPASRRASRNYSPGSRRASRNYSHHYQSLPRNTSISDRSSVHYDNEVRGPK